MATETMSAAVEHAPTSSEYIVHHLTHLTRVGSDSKQTAIIDFSVFNWDTIFWAVLVGVIGCFSCIARRARLLRASGSLSGGGGSAGRACRRSVQRDRAWRSNVHCTACFDSVCLGRSDEFARLSPRSIFFPGFSDCLDLSTPFITTVSFPPPT